MIEERRGLTRIQSEEGEDKDDEMSHEILSEGFLGARDDAA